MDSFITRIRAAAAEASGVPGANGAPARLSEADREGIPERALPQRSAIGPRPWSIGVEPPGHRPPDLFAERDLISLMSSGDNDLIHGRRSYGHYRANVRRVALTVLLTMSALTFSAVPAAGWVKSATVVLGSKTSFLPNGKGWGTPHPVALDNGGDPSGKAWSLRWTGWGRNMTSATGFTYYIPVAASGYRKGRLEFRATRLGRCSASGPRAYTRLQVRVAPLHGGMFGAWSLWNGRPNLCHS
jgi:hypothetical protein